MLEPCFCAAPPRQTLQLTLARAVSQDMCTRAHCLGSGSGYTSVPVKKHRKLKITTQSAGWQTNFHCVDCIHFCVSVK